MKHILTTSEIVQDLNRETEPQELCATADAHYDEERRVLLLNLDAFVRQVHHAGADECSRPEWLPKPESLRESVSLDQAADMARDIFHGWTKKVRDAAAAHHSGNS